MTWANRIGSLFALLALSVPAVAGAQRVEGGGARTLLGGGVSHGGFGAVHLRAGEVKSERSLFMGGEAAWVANQQLILGVGVWALVSENARIVATSGGVGASYRWVAGVALGGLRDEDLSGLTSELSLRVGRF